VTGANSFNALRASLPRISEHSSDYDLNPQFRPENPHLRPAAVLVPVIETSGIAQLILTKRASHLRHHPGQIAFPGGKLDEGDADATAAALREAHEEIGLAPANVEPIATLPPHETVTGFSITPVLARVRDDFCPIPETGEVEEVFRVPLAHVTNPARFSVQSRHWQGHARAYYTVPHGSYYIWGATARILRAIAVAVAS
jgi:8-oxo-dGTP pyrophosphatase MutT (NUDIX family)